MNCPSRLGGLVTNDKWTDRQQSEVMQADQQGAITTLKWVKYYSTVPWNLWFVNKMDVKRHVEDKLRQKMFLWLIPKYFAFVVSAEIQKSRRKYSEYLNVANTKAANRCSW